MNDDYTPMISDDVGHGVPRLKQPSNGAELRSVHASALSAKQLKEIVRYEAYAKEHATCERHFIVADRLLGLAAKSAAGHICRSPLGMPGANAEV